MARYLLIAAALAIAAWVLWPKKKQLPPEQAVAQAVDMIIEAANSKQPKPIIKRLSKKFQGDGMSRDQAKAALVMHLQRGSWSKVIIASKSIKMQTPTLVNVVIKAALARGGNVNSLVGLAPDSAGAFEFRTTWALEDDDEWRIISGGYKRLDLRDLTD